MDYTSLFKNPALKVNYAPAGTDPNTAISTYSSSWTPQQKQTAVNQGTALSTPTAGMPGFDGTREDVNRQTLIGLLQNMLKQKTDAQQQPTNTPATPTPTPTSPSQQPTASASFMSTFNKGLDDIKTQQSNLLSFLDPNKDKGQYDAMRDQWINASKQAIEANRPVIEKAYSQGLEEIKKARLLMSGAGVKTSDMMSKFGKLTDDVTSSYMSAIGNLSALESKAIADANTKELDMIREDKSMYANALSNTITTGLNILSEQIKIGQYELSREDQNKVNIYNLIKEFPLAGIKSTDSFEQAMQTASDYAKANPTKQIVKGENYAMIVDPITGKQTILWTKPEPKSDTMQLYDDLGGEAGTGLTAYQFAIAKSSWGKTDTSVKDSQTLEQERYGAEYAIRQSLDPTNINNTAVIKDKGTLIAGILAQSKFLTLTEANQTYDRIKTELDNADKLKKQSDWNPFN